MTKECQCFHRCAMMMVLGEMVVLSRIFFFVENIIYTIPYIFLLFIFWMIYVQITKSMHCHSILYVFSACSSSFELDQQQPRQQRSGIPFLRIFPCMSAWLEKEKRDYPRKILLWRKIDGMEWTTSFKAMSCMYVHYTRHCIYLYLSFFFADIEVKNLRDSFRYNLCTFIHFYYAHLLSAPSPRNGRQHRHHLRLLASPKAEIRVSFYVNHHEMCNTWSRYWENATYS